VLGWVVVLVLGFTVGAGVFNRLVQGGASDAMESIQGFERLSAATPYGGQILAVVDGVPVEEPRLREAVLRAAAELTELPGVGRVVTAYGEGAPPGLTSDDGTASLIAVDLAKGLESGDFDAAVDEVVTTLRRVSAAVDGAQVRVGGDVLINREVNEQVEQDTLLAEVVAIPAALVVMVLVFRGLVAAGIPIAGALVSISGSLLALLGLSYAIDLDSNVPSVTTILGLGLSIDYALLMVSRFREERAGGRGVADAVDVMAATAGRTIAFSGLTVATSLGGLFVFQSDIYRAIGAAGVVIVLLSLVASLTLTPALLGLFGHRIRAARHARSSDDGFFARLARGVQRRSVVVVVGVTAVLLLVAAPLLSINLQNGDASLLPRSFESRQVADTVATRFPGGGVEPVLVVAEAPAAEVASYAAGLVGRSGVASVGRVEPLGDSLTLVEVLPADAPPAVVQDLRADEPGFETYVTGGDALLVDFSGEIGRRGPWAVLAIALATFLLLFLMTRSVLIPLKAIVMNIVSLSATFGVVVWIFQQGHFEGLLGFTSSGGLETWVPVIVFAFAFGVSMDYEVFLLSRVKELHDAGVPTNRAVEVGLQRSGRIITSAALLVMIVFAGFAAGKMLGIKELGTALFVAVLIDATLVRCLLVPATMTLLGDLNWWAPPWLRRLHDRFGIDEHAPVVQLSPPRHPTPLLPLP